VPTLMAGSSVLPVRAAYQAHLRTDCLGLIGQSRTTQFSADELDGVMRHIDLLADGAGGGWALYSRGGCLTWRAAGRFARRSRNSSRSRVSRRRSGGPRIRDLRRDPTPGWTWNDPGGMHREVESALRGSGAATMTSRRQRATSHCSSGNARSSAFAAAARRRSMRSRGDTPGESSRSRQPPLRPRVARSATGSEAPGRSRSRQRVPAVGGCSSRFAAERSCVTTSPNSRSSSRPRRAPAGTHAARARSSAPLAVSASGAAARGARARARQRRRRRTLRRPAARARTAPPRG
jgi:hypothetical protein